MSEEKDAVENLKAIRKIDMLNEGLLTVILAFLIGFVGLVIAFCFVLFSFVFTEVFFIEQGTTGDAFFAFMENMWMFTSICFHILLAVFAIRCLVKPFYLVLSKRKVVKNG